MSEDDLPRWKSDLDVLATYGLNLVRTGVPSWLVAPSPGAWDDSSTDFYRRALDAARVRGLGVNLVVPGAPDWAQWYESERYLHVCSWFWSSMVDAFDDQVILWQAFNEADATHYQRFHSLDSATYASYLTDWNRLLGTARLSLGRKGTPVTTNLTGWPVDDMREQSWYETLDVIQDAVDVISLDLYTADDEGQINQLAARIDRVRSRYGKPVFVAEVGLQTAGSWTEADQLRYVPAAIRAIRQATPWGVCLYELRDQPSPAGFGITRRNGSRKPAFDHVLGSLAD